MFNKVNIINIVRGHMRTLYNAATGKVGIEDAILFGFAPILIAIILLSLGYVLSERSIAVLLAAYAILTGLLFNLLVLVFDLIRKEAEPRDCDVAAKAEWQNKQRLLKQTFASISFCVLEGITLTVATMASLMPWYWLQQVISFFVYAITTNFALTLLMILKRIHALLDSEFLEQKDV